MAASWLDWSRPLEVRPLANLSDAVRQPIGDLSRDLPAVALQSQCCNPEIRLTKNIALPRRSEKPLRQLRLFARK
jgi:hypothetical protein